MHKGWDIVKVFLSHLYSHIMMWKEWQSFLSPYHYFLPLYQQRETRRVYYVLLEEDETFDG